MNTDITTNNTYKDTPEEAKCDTCGFAFTYQGTLVCTKFESDVTNETRPCHSWISDGSEPQMTKEEIIELTRSYEEQLRESIKIEPITKIKVRTFESRTDCFGLCYEDVASIGMTYSIHFNVDKLNDVLTIQRVIIHELMHCAKSRNNHSARFQNAYVKACNILGVPYGDSRYLV